MNDFSTTKQYNYVALEWVKNEITETLKQARQSLECFVENPEGNDLDFCLIFVHQVQSVLKVIELPEATNLATEMESLIEAIRNDKVAQSNRNEALEVLMQAIIQLPLYLEKVQEKRQENQILVLTLLNDLRTARGEGILSKTGEITVSNLPIISALPDAKLAELNNPQLTGQLRKLRQMFQLALANIIRGNQAVTNLEYLAKVFARLEQICTNAPLGSLWEIAEALVAGIKNGEITDSASVRTLLRQVDQELKRLLDQGIKGINQKAPDELIKNLLFYISKAPGRSQQIIKIKQKYNLQEIVLDNQIDTNTNGTTLDQDTLHTVATTLIEEINKIKDTLDLFVRGDRSDIAEITSIKPQLTQIADTLIILGSNETRKLVLEQIALLDDLNSGVCQADDNLLLNIAGALLQVENKLNVMLDKDTVSNDMPTSDVNQINTVVIREACLGIERVKEIIVEYINSDWKPEFIAKVPSLMYEICGVIAMIPLPRATDLFKKCTDYIVHNIVEQQRHPSWEELDNLADSISAIEYYLEKLTTDYSNADEKSLDVAFESLNLLIADSANHSVTSDDKEVTASNSKFTESNVTAGNNIEPQSILNYVSTEEIIEEDINNTAEAKITPTDLSELELYNTENSLLNTPKINNTTENFVSELDNQAILVDNQKPTVGLSFNSVVQDANQDSATVKFDLERDLSSTTKTDTLSLYTADEAEIKTSTNGKFNLDLDDDANDNLDAPANLTSNLAELTTSINNIEELPISSQQVETETTKQIEDFKVNPNVPELLPPPADEEPVDEELREIFIEEAEEVLETINAYLPKWIANNNDKNSLTEVRRAFHTLKGSGRMVRALVLGELAWSVENLLNRVIDKTINVTNELTDLISQVVSLVPELCDEFAQIKQRHRHDVDILAATAHAMSKGEELPKVGIGNASQQKQSLISAENYNENVVDTTTQRSQEIQENNVNLDVELVQLHDFKQQELTPKTKVDNNLDHKLISIFKTETEGYLNNIQSFVDDCVENLPHSVTNELHRALHTLKGSASMADIAPILQVVKPLEKMAKFCKSHNIEWGQTEVNLLFNALQQIRQILAQISIGNMQLSNEAQELIANLNQLNQQHESLISKQRQSDCDELINPDSIKLFLIQSLDLLAKTEQILQNPINVDNLQNIISLLLAFKNKAHTARQATVIEICDALINLYQAIKVNDIVVNDNLLSELKRANEELTSMLDQIAAHWHASINTEYLFRLRNLTNTLVAQAQAQAQEQAKAQSVLSSIPSQNIQTTTNLQPLDWETISLYLDDAWDSLDSASSELEFWLSEPENTNTIALILGEIRILKSGARMAKLNSTLTVISSLEGLYRGVRTKKYSQSELLASLLLRCHETLAHHFDLLRDKQLPLDETELIKDITSFINGDNSPNPNGGKFDPKPKTGNDEFSLSSNDETNNNFSDLPVASTELQNSDIADIKDVLDAFDSNNKQNNNSYIDESTELIPNLDNTKVDNTNEVTTTEKSNFLQQELSAEQILPTNESTSSDDNLDHILNNLDDDFAGDFNDDLINMFVQDAQQSCIELTKLITDWQKDTSSLQPLKSANTILLGLKENAELSDLYDFASITDKLAIFYTDLTTGKLFYRPAIVDFLQDSNNLIVDYLAKLSAKQDLPSFDSLLVKLEDIYLEATTPYVVQDTTELNTDISSEINSEPLYYDSELLPTFLEEAQDVLENANNALQRWINAPSNIIELASLQRDLHTVKGGARMAEVNELATFAHELEYLYEALNDGRLQANDQLFDLLNTCHDQLVVMLEQLQTTRTMPKTDSFIDALQKFRTDPKQYQAIPLSATISDAKTVTSTPVDADLLEIFFDEAEELLAEFEKSLIAWDKNHSDDSHINNIMRILHTLKGSARLANLHNIGNVSHELEQKINNARNQNIDIATLNEEIQTNYLNLYKLLEQTKKQPEPEQQKDKVTDKPSTQTPTKTATTQEVIKIAVDKIDHLVNLAGETSIYRGRIEQQVTDFGTTLTEMESTIERVRDQLRRLDIETQAQILSSHKEETSSYDDFDPLELDRHSHLQQLSRSLFESASDLLDLTSTLHARSRDTQSLLIQQAQINTELQEGLMRTRMISFTHIAPRLNRIVRQISRELGKKVEFKIINADNEIDRSVLERVIAPLEHMMRNAIDHGIEDVATRKKLGKPEVGQIHLELSREGGDIVLNLMDDGAGLNVDVIRKKAISLNLMNEADDLPEREIMRFILKAGFSTAQKVTQISGRGVGMDVAISEVKQIGGVIDINSSLGKGTTFSIRLPFTLSVNRALMVYCGEDLYAVPLNTIEGIVRISPADLKKYYNSDISRFEYAGQDYDLRYFGDLVQNGQHPKLAGNMPLPVILVRSREFAVAIQIDELAGSHEIVVKNLGKQFAELQGVSGATLLGDGRVVLILDLLAIVRSLHLRKIVPKVITTTPHTEVDNSKQRQITVMVVDDSVTVRKVTTRLLERRGILVATAKDGVDAIAYLQENNKPDIMLLDIEMPRMDGFEVANIVRHDERLKDLPIIMITSRTGDKHRERAISIGVNSYLGKPYQEDQLLQAIEQLIGIEV